jgi:hypothetical protein
MHAVPAWRFWLHQGGGTTQPKATKKGQEGTPPEEGEQAFMALKFNYTVIAALGLLTPGLYFFYPKDGTSSRKK